ncbi:SpoIID/LytB domain-containing protein [Paenibacillus alvei]|uniref:SpoIID/LytB domain-containing protein n=1 Tax=Paenibacillus alvei TaxID=44250 RepID=UPI0018CE88EA|nr:SpoIID/LytB domain-containing protein [Paenibacillus alvei]MBG9737486.1 stage II sporulation protein SpoIID [Paenibacillus alvei]MBG9746143.1 stage II sporulation protein SpoIID [Paenibacillus alvei]MCY9578993.1 SpoIID/LytB domain-containing protein [Paenibacillus alvei]MCY9583421.1 SpoIID/LytB domain-containing protein [Paenibacillus alvei]
MNNNRNVIRSVASVLTGVLLLSGAPYTLMQPANVAYAAASNDARPEQAIVNNHIRVALFANLSKGSPGQTELLSLASTASLQLEARLGSSSKGSVEVGGEQARFSADDYKVKLLETDDLSAAQSALKKAQASGSAYIIQIPRRGTTFFAVYAGSYASNKSASQAADRLRGASGMSSILQGYEPSVVGPQYVQAGTFSSRDEAKSVQQALLDADLDAYVVTLATDSGARTAVWAGQVASDTQLTGIKKVVASKGYTAGAVQAQGAVIHTVEVAGNNTTPHYRVFGNAKWVVKPSTQTTIKVNERSGRAYRGVMEVSIYKDKLALVNEVPLEEYLLSVVGGEVYSSWPMDALKAQAVAARTFALYQGNKFEIANVVDTTLSQAYFGVEKEHPDIKKAVEATAGEVLMQNGKLIEAIFNSSAGGKTADPMEVWGGSYDYFQVVDSPDDVAQEGAKSWYRVTLPDGKTGYVREDVVKLSGQTATVLENGTNVRPTPAIQTGVQPVGKVDKGTKLTVLETVFENNEMNWVRGPYTAEQITSWLKERTDTALSGTIKTLAVTKRGPSGRAIKIEADGKPVEVSYPDNFRYAFGGLPSTLFDIVPNGTGIVSDVLSSGSGTGSGSSSISIIGADGKLQSVKDSSKLRVVSGSSKTGEKLPTSIAAVNGKGTTGKVGSDKVEQKPVVEANSFLFVGKGNGHGIGMSQWGAKGLADQGYDYKAILQYYYKNVELVKR